MRAQRPLVRVLGIRGVPAMLGGFEAFTEGLALALAALGWRVGAYCQEFGDGPETPGTWRGGRFCRP